MEVALQKIWMYKKAASMIRYRINHVLILYQYLMLVYRFYNTKQYNILHIICHIITWFTKNVKTDTSCNYNT